MTAYVFSPTTSRYVTNDNAFTGGTTAADLLTVTDGAFLYTTGGGAAGASLDGVGGWTVSIAGTIYSTNGPGLFIDPTKAASTIKVAAGGGISGLGSFGFGIYAGGPVTINNAGVIIGLGTSVFLAGSVNAVVNSGDIGSGSFSSFAAITAASISTNTISNSGRIYGDINLGMGNDVVTNTGNISGYIALGGGNNRYTGTATSVVGVIGAGDGNNIIYFGGESTGGITLGNGNNTLTIANSIGVDVTLGNGKNAITVLGSNDVYGGFTTGSGDDTLTNAGNLSLIALGAGNNTFINNTGGKTSSITVGDGNDVVVNHGTYGLAGDILALHEGVNSVANTGAFNSGVSSGNSDDRLTNSGSFAGDINLGYGANVVSNTGTMTSSITFYDGNDRLSNSGNITGNINLGDGKNVVGNSGSIHGNLAFGSAADVMTNTGHIDSATLIQFGDGANVLTNSGTVVSTALTFGTDDDTIINNGQLVSFGGISLGDGANHLYNYVTIIGNVYSGSGNDNFVNTGHIFGFSTLGAGINHYVGSIYSDTVQDDLGTDSVNLGSGNDIYLAFNDPTGNNNGHADGKDVISGGAGIDLYDASGATSAVYINIDTAQHTYFDGVEDNIPVAGGSAAGAEIGSDAISGFENATGGSGADYIFGSGVANVLKGGDGGDSLYGFAGNDVLDGGAGVDTLIGGAGADQLTGGADNDYFVFTSPADSGVTTGTRDVILDFQDGHDLIDLHLIDADARIGAASAGDQTFTYINGNSSSTPVAFFTGQGHAGELRSYTTTTGEIIEGDTDGDGKANFAIEVRDPAHAIVFTSADFIL